MSDDEIEDPAAKLQDLNQQATELGDRCLYRSRLRIANEARRLARIEQQLIPYMTASFHVMNDSRNLLQPVVGREASIELVTLLESEDRARQFQPNLPEEEYERTRWWLTACAYDNLAVNTAESNGYNSDGMHQCITDGIQVCRRTGKLQCISCFREYATDVYIAADDLEMALHHARVGINNRDPGPHDRRHVGAKDSVRILAHQGLLNAALEMLDLAWKLCEVYHSPYAGRLDTYLRAVELFHLAGCPERLEKLPRLLSDEEGRAYQGPADAVLIEPPRDEFPSYFLEKDLTEAFVACCRGDYDQAVTLVQPWDVSLREQKCMTKWFEVRLRLVAIARMTGKLPRAQALARPLREFAESFRDWHTLRRLNRILDESVPPTPLALSGNVDRGPFHQPFSAASDSSIIEERSDHGGLVAPEEGDAPSPLVAVVQGFYRQLVDGQGDSTVLFEITENVLGISPDAVDTAEIATELLGFARFVRDVNQAHRAWAWADAVARRFSQNASVVSVFADLAGSLRESAEGGLDETILEETLDKLHREALDLDPGDAANFSRAGAYYFSQENNGEAERCLARAFRLNRKSGRTAMLLADLYCRTERPRDGLAVLDMALRDGCDDDEVAWEAAITAINLEQFEAALTYLDKYDELLPGQPWCHFYRASALLELSRPQEALESLDRESANNPGKAYHVNVLKASCLAALKQDQEFRQQLDLVLQTPASSVDYLTANGLRRMFARLWISTNEFLKSGDTLLTDFEDRLLQMGLAPSEMLARDREAASRSDEPQSVNFYRCLLRQPVDERWEFFAGRLAGEEDWVAYEITWGVLAKNEQDAGILALAIQNRCYPLNAEIMGIEQDGEGYSDHPGILWQGYREGVTSTDETE